MNHNIYILDIKVFEFENLHTIWSAQKKYYASICSSNIWVSVSTTPLSLRRTNVWINDRIKSNWQKDEFSLSSSKPLTFPTKSFRVYLRGIHMTMQLYQHWIESKHQAPQWRLVTNTSLYRRRNEFLEYSVFMYQRSKSISIISSYSAGCNCIDVKKRSSNLDSLSLKLSLLGATDITSTEHAAHNYLK